MSQMFFLSRSQRDNLYKQLMHSVCMVSVLLSGAAWSAVSQTPLFLAQPRKPNIMYTLDNSGSMEWGSVTGYDGLNEYTEGQRNMRAYYLY
ncbi:MAG: hypothetical protein NWQ13_08490 [Glaciimonas sp.]|nr:hypothetical protein [Glaciimonas sp.]